MICMSPTSESNKTHICNVFIAIECEFILDCGNENLNKEACGLEIGIFIAFKIG